MNIDERVELNIGGNVEMRFCPECGLELKEQLDDKRIIKKCDCGFTDWDNWVYVSTVVVCYNSPNNLPADADLRGELTRALLRDLTLSSKGSFWK